MNFEFSFFRFSSIPADSEVPPGKPADIGETSGGHHTHAEHAMSLSMGERGKNGGLVSNDDSAYDDYVDEVENMRSRTKGSNSYDINKVLSHLGLPEYEYVDAQNYDYLLPTHLTYGKEQTVKLHNAKIMSRENRCCVSFVSLSSCVEEQGDRRTTSSSSFFFS